MADKQLARSEAAEFGVLADDDPLAELARIVGYDNRPAVQQLQELERHREMIAREPVLAEPVLDLEDELLREFDVYDAPQAAPAVQYSSEPVRVVEPVLYAPQSELLEPVVVRQQQETSVTYAAEPVADDKFIAAREPASARADVVQFDTQADSVSHSWSEPAAAPETADGWVVDQWNEAEFDATDLERELELSIGYDDVPAAEIQPAAAPTFAPQPHFIGDIASFEERPIAPPALPAFAEPVESLVEPQIQEVLPQWQPEAPVASAEAVITPDDSRGIDALLADIERFPVPAKAVVAAVAAAAPVAEVTRKVNYPFTPTFSRATPVASNGGASSQKAFATPLPASVIPAAVLPAVAETVHIPAEAVVAPVIVEAAPALKAAVDQEPEFDLDNFEIDLSGIDLDIEPAEFETAAQESAVAPVKAAVAVPVAAPVVAPLAAVAETAMPYFEEQASQEPVNEPESVLPFDPSMIGDTEESLTAIADLNVPQLPVIEQERPAVHHPDYDLDIDAEMAQLFGTPSRAAPLVAEVPAGSRQAAVAPAHASAAPVETDFDEFEKAMEEDFRLSLSQRQETDPSNDRLAVGSGYAANDYEDERRGSGKRRLALLAATVAGLAIFGGVGVYAFMGGSGSSLSGGEPKIILADKSPVKMVPVEKGGKTVPNQDKAVYDRVAGAQDSAPQQGTLVSSTEAPIDVVQRTLTPENLPDEGFSDDLPGVTPVDDEGADRLLPDGQVADDASADAEQTPAVAPRKVRTMIVKPDGTLVAREETVAQPETQVAANNAQPQVKVVKTTAVTNAVETSSTPKSQPVVEQLAEQSQKSALAQAADATVNETAPVRPVKTTAVADANPQPQARPVEEPAKVVDTFKSDTAASQPVAETKPLETASIAPGTYVIQIASLPSEAEAQKSYQTLSGKFGSVIGGKGVDIKKADIAGKGTYYRVRIPAGSRDAANALCSQYKSAGGSCLVTR